MGVKGEARQDCSRRNGVLACLDIQRPSSPLRGSEALARGTPLGACRFPQQPPPQVSPIPRGIQALQKHDGEHLLPPVMSVLSIFSQ